MNRFWILYLVLAATIPFCAARATPQSDPVLKDLLGQINRLLSKNDYERAAPIAEMAVSRFPQSYDARVARGRAYMGMEEDEKAISDFRWALKLRPKDPEVHAQLSRIYYVTKDYKPALKYVDLAILYAPTQPTYYEEKSEIFRALGQWSDAEEAITKALQIVPEHAHWRLERMKMRIKEGKWNGAIEDGSFCVDRMPKFKIGILQMRAKAYSELKRYTQAEKDLKTAISMEPDDRLLHIDLRDLYQRESKNDMAEKESKFLKKLGAGL